MSTLRAYALHRDDRAGTWFMLVAGRQQVEIRVTPSGLLRIGAPQPTSKHWSEFDADMPAICLEAAQ